MARKLLSKGHDVIHIMNSAQLVAVIRRHHPRARIALHMHCDWLTALPRAFVDLRLREVDLMIGCGEHITTTVAEAFPEHSTRCVTVPNAVELVDESDLTDAMPNRVLFIGRLSPEKGIHDLFEAFRQVLTRIPDSRLYIAVGEGSSPSEYLVGLSDDPKVKALARYYDEALFPGGPVAYASEVKRLAGPQLGKWIIFEGRCGSWGDPHTLSKSRGSRKPLAQ